MRRWIALFLIVLLPLRGLAGDLMAMALIGPATGAGPATAAAPCHEALPEHAMERAMPHPMAHATTEVAHGGAHDASLSTPSDRSHGAPHGAANDASHDIVHAQSTPTHGAACSACQLCHSAVMTVADRATTLGTAPLALPVFEPVSSASHVPPPGLKPPIS